MFGWSGCGVWRLTRLRCPPTSCWPGATPSRRPCCSGQHGPSGRLIHGHLHRYRVFSRQWSRSEYQLYEMTLQVEHFKLDMETCGQCHDGGGQTQAWDLPIVLIWSDISCIIKWHISHKWIFDYTIKMIWLYTYSSSVCIYTIIYIYFIYLLRRNFAWSSLVIYNYDSYGIF